MSVKLPSHFRPAIFSPLNGYPFVSGRHLLPHVVGTRFAFITFKYSGVHLIRHQADEIICCNLIAGNLNVCVRG